MNCSAEKSSRKLDIGALDRRRAAMVTAALAVWALGGPAIAREARPIPPLDLFAGKPRLRGTVHHAAVPLPRPRPAEAPKAEEAAEKPEPEKAAEPAAPQPSACPPGV